MSLLPHTIDSILELDRKKLISCESLSPWGGWFTFDQTERIIVEVSINWPEHPLPSNQKKDWNNSTSKGSKKPILLNIFIFWVKKLQWKNERDIKSSSTISKGKKERPNLKRKPPTKQIGVLDCYLNAESFKRTEAVCLTALVVFSLFPIKRDFNIIGKKLDLDSNLFMVKGFHRTKKRGSGGGRRNWNQPIII